MKEEKLRVSNQRRYVFDGEEIYKGSTKTQDTTRWGVIRVFIADDGQYVVGRARLTEHRRTERDTYDAHEARDESEVIGLVAEHTPELESEVVTALKESREMRSRIVTAYERRMAT